MHANSAVVSTFLNSSLPISTIVEIPTYGGPKLAAELLIRLRIHMATSVEGI